METRCFFGAAAVEATCRKETTLIRSMAVFTNRKLQLCLVSILGTKSWVPHHWIDSFHLAFSQPVSWHTIRGGIIRKKCLIGMRSTGSLPHGDNCGSSNESRTRQQRCLLAYINSISVHTSRNMCTLRAGMLAQLPSSSREPFSDSWV